MKLASLSCLLVLIYVSLLLSVQQAGPPSAPTPSPAEADGRDVDLAEVLGLAECGVVLMKTLSRTSSRPTAQEHRRHSSEGWGARPGLGAPGETCCHAGSPTQKALHLVQAQQSLFQIPRHFGMKTPAFPVCPGPSGLRDWSCLHSSTPPDLPVHRYSSLGGITQDNLVSSLPGPLLSVTHIIP